jgi:3D (Asp-Asp-Asp) domain-containing protein
MAAPAAAAIAKKALGNMMKARAARAAAGGGNDGGGLFKTVATALAVFMLAIIIGVGACGGAIKGCLPGTTDSSDLPGTWDGPGSLGGVAGTGVSAAELRSAQAVGKDKITAGQYRSTAYAPVAGGVNCGNGCGLTASGIRVDGGKRKGYLIASNPKLLGYGKLVYIHPNPYDWAGPFVVADTGGDFNGSGRLDFYTFEPGSLSKALRWGNQRMVKVSSKPIVEGGPNVTDDVDTGTDDTPSSDVDGGDSSTMMRPVATGPFTSPFGPRWGKIHEGVDIGVPIGTPVVAALDGRVAFKGVMSGYGNFLCLSHAGNLVTCYAHLSRFASIGSSVKRGQTVAMSGNTGGNYAPHLHFEVRKGKDWSGTAVDPAPYLKGAPVPTGDAAAETEDTNQCVCPAPAISRVLPGEIPSPYDDIFTKAAAAAHMDPRLLAAIFYYGENGKRWPNAKGPWPTSSAGATGPFQFLPSTWKGYARDGDGDGDKDINDLTDAAFGAAAYLAASGAKDGASEAEIRKAIFAYNHADWYVNQVYNGMQEFTGKADAEPGENSEVDTIEVSDEAPSADCADGAIPTGGEAGQRAAEIATKYKGKSARLEPFDGFKPAQFFNSWCAWFFTNVWRLAGINIPMSGLSSYPYTWAQQSHPDWVYKRVGEAPKGRTPPVGSALMYGSGPANTSTSEHINMVQKVLPDGSFMVIGGNQGPLPGHVTTQGPCRLVGGANLHMEGPGCDGRPMYGIVAPPSDTADDSDKKDEKKAQTVKAGAGR